MNVWILCTPRTGSSYLCNLLNNSKIFKVYKDNRLKNNIGPIEKDLAFNEWLRIFNNHIDFEENPPSTLKAIFHQYIEVFGGIDQNQRYGPGFYSHEYDRNFCNKILNKFNVDYISNILPNIKFIYLKRKDIIEQSLSLYFARFTKKYHIYNQSDFNNYIDIKIPYDPSLLLKCYKDALYYNSCWDNFSNNVKNIYYEDLIFSTENTLYDIFKFLNINNLNINKIIYETNKDKRLYPTTRINDKIYFRDKLELIIKNKFL